MLDDVKKKEGTTLLQSTHSTLYITVYSEVKADAQVRKEWRYGDLPLAEYRNNFFGFGLQ